MMQNKIVMTRKLAFGWNASMREDVILDVPRPMLIPQGFVRERRLKR